eukprot:201298_1
MVDVTKIITISYIVIQVTVAWFISIIGAIHVKRCIDGETQQIELKSSVELNERQAEVDSTEGNIKSADSTTPKTSPKPNALNTVLQSNQNKAKKEAGDPESDDNKEDATLDQKDKTKTKTFSQLWARTIWKMRSVYGGLVVHCFDVLTDVLVIIQWMQLPDDDVEHVNPQIMAYSGISVVAGSKIISSIAIFVKEGNPRRAALQFVDLLIFEEIYETHKKIISQIKNRKSIKEKDIAIESTLSFKYVRNLEAVFESIPQSVLQLVFIMRDPLTTIRPIFIISIIQSIISMTNSILNNDYTQMQEDKWKRHKQRLPPTWECFKHALSRLSEVIYRIGLLSLFWTVCGGELFSIMMVIDLVQIIGRSLLFPSSIDELGDMILLSLNSFIVSPSEMVYDMNGEKWYHMVIDCCDFPVGFCVMGAFNLCCCVGLASFFISLGRNILDMNCQTEVHWYPTIRIGTSLMELIFMVFYGILFDSGARKPFLLSPKHGWDIFIVTCICFFIYTQYLLLFPDFGLPLGVNVRSKWGYAFGNELTELKKFKVRTSTGWGPCREVIKEPSVFWPKFWDERFERSSATAAVFALANENYHIVQWLEEQGAVSHKAMDPSKARQLL